MLGTQTGRQDGRQRRIHWAMAAPQFMSMLCHCCFVDYFGLVKELGVSRCGPLFRFSIEKFLSATAFFLSFFLSSFPPQLMMAKSCKECKHDKWSLPLGLLLLLPLLRLGVPKTNCFIDLLYEWTFQDWLVPYFYVLKMQ